MANPYIFVLVLSEILKDRREHLQVARQQGRKNGRDQSFIGTEKSVICCLWQFIFTRTVCIMEEKAPKKNQNVFRENKMCFRVAQ